MLTKKVRFQAVGNGSTNIWILPQKNLDATFSPIITVGGSPATYSAFDAVNGTVTLDVTPANGAFIDGIFRETESNREEFLKFTHMRLFSGINDARMFIFGNGSFRRWSDIANAEYFPIDQFNEMSMDGSNVTDLVTWQSSQLVLTETESYISRYIYDETLGRPRFDTQPLTDKGQKAKGQTVLIRSNPITVFNNQLELWTVLAQGRTERASTTISRRVKKKHSNHGMKPKSSSMKELGNKR